MVPSYNHSYLAYRIGRLLDREEKFNIHIELALEINKAEYVVDVAAYPRQPVDFLHDTIKVQTLPLLVVEIISPTQSVQEFVEKAEDYLCAGIPACWLVIPPTKTIVVFHEITRPEAYSSGIFSEPALGIDMNVADIFV